MHYDVFPYGLLSGAMCPRASCQDRCGKSSTDDHSLCSCDHHSQLLSDCCVDFSTECFNLVKLFLSKPYHSYNANLAVIENGNGNGFESERHLLVAFRNVDYCPKPSSLREKYKNTDYTNIWGNLSLSVIPRAMSSLKINTVLIAMVTISMSWFHLNIIWTFHLHTRNSICTQLGQTNYGYR